VISDSVKTRTFRARTRPNDAIEIQKLSDTLREPIAGRNAHWIIVRTFSMRKAVRLQAEKLRPCISHIRNELERFSFFPRGGDAQRGARELRQLRAWNQKLFFHNAKIYWFLTVVM
jgi:hypothetical protein